MSRLLITIISIVCIPIFQWGQACNMSNYNTATLIGPAMFPYFSAGSGVTVTATVFNVPTLGNFSYTCGANTFNCSNPAWWHQYSTGWIRLNFSSPVYKMTWALNGSNTSEVFTFVPGTGTVTLNDYCSGGGNFSSAGNQLTCNGSLGTIVSVNHATGMSQLTVYHNGVGSGSRMTPLDCFVTTPLPVALSLFNGYDEGKTNRLYWETETEINSDAFIVEKSIDAINYEILGTVKGAGYSNTQLSYALLDERPYQLTYYRLKQVDYDGEYKYYGPVIIKNENIADFQVHPVYPNPADEGFFIDMSSNEPVNAKVVIYDAVGKLMYSTPFSISGMARLEINCTQWAAGIYSASIFNEASGNQVTQRIIVQ